MTKLSDAVKKANENGYLGLMIYIIPNFPNPNVYKQTLELLYRNERVTILETTFPVRSNFSQFANETIRNAHITAAQFGSANEVLNALEPFKKPSITVLYEDYYRQIGFENILEKIKGKIDGVTFEWIVDDILAHVEPCRRQNIEIVFCADPEMTDAELQRDLSATIDEPIIYLTTAAMTGAELYNVEKIKPVISTIRSIRPNAKILAGLGIKSAKEIKLLSQIDGIDGVIIGTAFLKKMSEGVESVEMFLQEITSALKK